MWLYQHPRERVEFSSEAIPFPGAAISIVLTLSPPLSLNVTLICKIQSILLNYMGKQATYLTGRSDRYQCCISYCAILFTLALYGPWF